MPAYPPRSMENRRMASHLFHIYLDAKEARGGVGRRVPGGVGQVGLAVDRVAPPRFFIRAQF